MWAFHKESKLRDARLIRVGCFVTFFPTKTLISSKIGLKRVRFFPLTSYSVFATTLFVFTVHKVGYNSSTDDQTGNGPASLFTYVSGWTSACEVAWKFPVLSASVSLCSPFGQYKASYKQTESGGYCHHSVSLWLTASFYKDCFLILWWIICGLFHSFCIF